MTWILNDPEIMVHPDQLVGGKARGLAHAQLKGLTVPPFCVVLPHSFDVVSGTVQMKPEAESAVMQELAQTFSGVPFLSVRSSAMAEDGTEASFAGMLDSFLYVSPEEVVSRTNAVAQSFFTPRVAAYCQEHGLDAGTMCPAVLIQTMVSSEKSGIAFGADPVSGSRQLVMVSAAWGLGSGLVSGECVGDTIYLTHELTLAQQEVVTKSQCHQFDTDQGCVATVAVSLERQDAPVLTEQESIAVAQLALHAGVVFNAPQDIEWAMSEGVLYLLQSRPITALPPPLSAEEECWHEWDNSLVVESWPGVVTPLTYSLAAQSVAGIYRDMAQLTCLPKVAADVYRCQSERLTAHLQGHVYLDQLALEELWLMAPSFVHRVHSCWEASQQLWARFAKAASGVQGGPVFLSELVELVARWLGLVPKGLQLVWGYVQLPFRVKQFQKDVARLIRPLPLEATDIERWTRVEALWALLTERWQVPTLNTYYANRLSDFIASVSPLKEKALALANFSEQMKQPLLSQQFVAELNELAKLVQQSPELTRVFQSGSLTEVQQALTEYPDVEKALTGFLALFGQRCEEDMKLESVPWSDDPLPLLQTVGVLAATPEASGNSSKKPTGSEEKESLVCQWLLQEYHKRMVHREELRLMLTDLIGALRRELHAIGKGLCDAGRLAQSEDLLFLYRDELQTMMQDEPETYQERIVARQAVDTRQRELPPLPDQFRAWGPLIPKSTQVASVARLREKTVLVGQACAAGQVQGEVVWYDPQMDKQQYQGKILAAPYGNPSLVQLYPVITGLLLERGSVLSHAAIVARELQVPTVLDLPGLSVWLEEGDTVMLDGAAGHVTRVDASA